MHLFVTTANGSPFNFANVPQTVKQIQKPFELDELFPLFEKHCGKP
jgi:hypothetical protein